MSNRTIYNALVAAGMTPEGACGLMGNMMAESTMKANIAQRGMTKLSDEDYTAQVDNGLINFADGIGYGLCQWTESRERKPKLLAFAKNKGVSVGDEAMQVQFCIRELTQEYPMVMLVLKTSHDIDECTDRVCDKYERPAINNYAARRSYARQFYNEFCGSGALAQTPVQETHPGASDWKVAGIQLIMQHDGYWGDVDGLKSPEFFAALRQYTEDMENC